MAKKWAPNIMEREKRRGLNVEFLLVGDSKLKMLLSESEMKEYKLGAGDAESCGSGFRRSFFKILEIAKAEVGFDVGGDKVLIQFYPMQGACEIFVTKLGLLSDASARVVARSDKITMLSRKRGVYFFEDAPALAKVCALIAERCDGVLPDCDAYSDGSHYFLSIDEYGRGGEVMEFPFIIEYGTALSREFDAYISEHTSLLAKGDAVKRFSGG